MQKLNVLSDDLAHNTIQAIISSSVFVLSVASVMIGTAMPGTSFILGAGYDSYYTNEGRNVKQVDALPVPYISILLVMHAMLSIGKGQPGSADILGGGIRVTRNVTGGPYVGNHITLNVIQS